ncbi:hypothetical protein D5S18_00285 [Nocardia panacis]|uniref:Uncharacterized protein n=1 Tax=Nocardia panacis TaxID=2340916 RepID=A0A3A4KJX0_9NOCA|nr:hypothetical protein D5S18_00285 [Nocardia panacis]
MWSAYIDAEPRRLSFDEEDEGSYLVTVITGDPIPVEVSILFSEWLHNLRAALDNSLYFAAAIESGHNPPPHASALQFPIATSAGDFSKQRNRIRDLSQATQDDIESIQPYNAQPDHLSNILYWVHELARLDRHRHHHLFGSRVVWMSGVADRGTVSPLIDNNDDFYIDDGLIVARIQLEPPYSDTEPDHRVRFDMTCELDIPEWRGRASSPMNRVTLADRMQRVEDFVAHHVVYLEETSPTRT